MYYIYVLSTHKEVMTFLWLLNQNIVDYVCPLVQELAIARLGNKEFVAVQSWEV